VIRVRNHVLRHPPRLHHRPHLPRLHHRCQEVKESAGITTVMTSSIDVTADTTTRNIGVVILRALRPVTSKSVIIGVMISDIISVIIGTIVITTENADIMTRVRRHHQRRSISTIGGIIKTTSIVTALHHLPVPHHATERNMERSIAKRSTASDECLSGNIMKRIIERNLQHLYFQYMDLGQKFRAS